MLSAIWTIPDFAADRGVSHWTLRKIVDRLTSGACRRVGLTRVIDEELAQRIDEELARRRGEGEVSHAL